MNASILAARMATAIATIEKETRRLGGDLTIAPGRGDVAHRQLSTVEAIAAALAAIDSPTTPPKADAPATAKEHPAPKGRGK